MNLESYLRERKRKILAPYLMCGYPSAGHRGRAVGDRAVDVAGHLLALPGVDERAHHVGGVGRIAIGHAGLQGVRVAGREGVQRRPGRAGDEQDEGCHQQQWREHEGLAGEHAQLSRARCLASCTRTCSGAVPPGTLRAFREPRRLSTSNTSWAIDA